MMPIDRQQHGAAPADQCMAALRLSLFALIIGVAGCAGDSAPPKASHFEHDHHVAPHWPNDLADAATKIRQRLGDWDQQIAESERLANEIAEIVSWVPEIAADTPLSEQDWIPLDNAAESLSANLRASGNELSSANRNQIVTLCELIERLTLKISDQHETSKDPTP